MESKTIDNAFRKQNIYLLFTHYTKIPVNISHHLAQNTTTHHTSTPSGPVDLQPLMASGNSVDLF